jgi:hypothetical protein
VDAKPDFRREEIYFLMESNPPADESTEESASERVGLELFDLGAETTAAAFGAGLGLVLGPPGAVAGALTGPAVVRLIKRAGRTVLNRLISPNEAERVGTALYVAVGRFKQRQEAGESPRDDGLFEPGEDPRGVLEGSLLAAARSYDDLKVPYIGAFYASFLFESEVAVDTALFLLGLWDRLTYHQLVVLAYFADRELDEERMQVAAQAEEEGQRMTEMLATELTELTNQGLIGVRLPDGSVEAYGGTVGTLGGGAQMMSKTAAQLAPMRLGDTLVRMAELDKIPENEKRGVVELLRGEIG